MDYRKALLLKRDYPQDVRNQIRIFSIDKKLMNTTLIGSYSYRSSNASDIDLFEEIKKDTIHEIIITFRQHIQKVVNDITLRKDNIYGEVKCGLDHLYYDIPFGYCRNNIYYMDENFASIMANFFYKKFITKEELDTILDISNNEQRGQYEYEVIQTMMRSHYILRWSSNEIMKGYKILVSIDNKAYKYTIEDGIVEKSAINIEGIFRSSDNRYVECSNFIALEYSDANGKTVMLNMPDLYVQKRDYYFGEDLKKSMYTLLYSKYTAFNPFKAIKRMFSYARHYKNIDLLNKAYNIINSQIGNLYNLNTQLKTISKVLKSHGHKPIYMETIYHQIDMIRWNIQSILLSGFNDTSIIEYLKKILSTDIIMPQKEVAEHLDSMTKELSKYINQLALQEAIKYGLYPLPNYLMPSNPPF